MSTTSLLPILSVIGVSLLSLVGILFFLFQKSLIERILLYLVSFSTGALLGDVFIHIMPDMALDATFFPHASLIILLGILFSFLIEKIIHWRHCHILGGHDGHHHPVGVLSLIGESLHNFIDGIVIAAAYLASPGVGIATTLAVVFHEIPHEIGNYAILLHSGYTRQKALLFNLLSGATAILGACSVLFLSQWTVNIVQYALPFAAGNLLYIAGSDLIPELHKHTRVSHSLLQLFWMIAGMAIMYSALFFE